MTTAGWTPLFPRAAAVVTDIGAALSRARWASRTGDRIRVDGEHGTVRVLRASEPEPV